ncbi:V-type ATP synthase subunit F [Chloroflexota bacterium]
MTSIQHLNIAVIGDEDLVSAMRLAGVSRYHIIKEEHEVGEDVRQALTKLIGEPEVGIIAIQEDYARYVEDLIAQVQEGKNLTPVIIEVPPKHGTKYEDVTQYYKGYVRKFTGFDVEI